MNQLQLEMLGVPAGHPDIPDTGLSLLPRELGQHTAPNVCEGLTGPCLCAQANPEGHGRPLHDERATVSNSRFSFS